MLLGRGKGPHEGLGFHSSHEGFLVRYVLNGGRCSRRTLKGGSLRWSGPCGHSSLVLLEIEMYHLMSVMYPKQWEPLENMAEKEARSTGAKGTVRPATNRGHLPSEPYARQDIVFFLP